MGRPALSPKGADLDQAVVYRGSLRSDDGAQFDREFGLDAAGIAPTVTWGTNPEAAAPIKERIPDPVSAPGDAEHDPANRNVLVSMRAVLPDRAPIGATRRAAFGCSHASGR